MTSLEVTGSSPVDVVRALDREGRLESDFAQFVAVLAGLDDAGRRTVGSAAGRLDADAARRLNPDAPVAAIAVIGSSTVRGLSAPLKTELVRHGLVPDIRTGGHDGWAMELLDEGSSVFDHAPTVTVVLLDATVVTRHLDDTWTAHDVIAALDSVAAQLEQSLVSHASRRTTVVTSIPLPTSLLAMTIDLASKARIGAAWRRFNARLLDLAAENPSIVVIDSDAVLAEIGPITDPRMAAYAGVAFGADFMSECARQLGHLMRSRAGRASKVLALDLDGTLWDGILSEDGVAGLNLKHGPSGEAFATFRRALRQLKTQGVLLTILSKNDHSAVSEALSSHPDSDLAETDFVAVRADWNPKPANLVALADDLNLGVDAFVFVDDSDSERGAMRSALPTLPVVGVDANEPALHLVSLLRDGWFTTASITSEDAERTQRYRTEVQRKTLRDNALDPDTYLRDLGTVVSVFEPAGGEIARIAQITQRTNQFNLTTVRMDESEVRAWIDDPSKDVVAIECSDRFGDHGIVGVIFLDRSPSETFIRNFALSCRVLARGVETALISHVTRVEFDRGATEVVGWRSPSPKNSATAELYPRHGFTASTTDRATTHGLVTGTLEFTVSVGDAPVIPPHIELKERQR